MARILIIAYTTYIHDGRVRRQAEALARHGNQVDVISLADKHDGAAKTGVRILGLKMARYRGANRFRYLASYARFMAAAMAVAFIRGLKRRYDVAIACTMPDLVVLCAAPLKLMGTKVVLDIHDTMPELYRDKFAGKLGMIGARVLMIQERVCARLAKRVLAVHEPHRQRLISTGIPAEKISVLMNLPDAALFNPSRPFAHPPELAGRFVLAWHGTLAQRLGVGVAIEAMSIIRDSMPDAHLLLVGSGDYSQAAKKLVSELALDSRITFLDDWVPIEQLPKILSRADAGLVPNRLTNATRLMLPEKLLEYMLLGIPVVAARLPVIEYYMGGENVIYFTPDDPQDLARAIEALRHDSQARQRLGMSGRQHVLAMGWDDQIRGYLKMIDSIAGASHPPRRGDSAIERELNPMEEIS